jgi:starch-binding outer membrane protein, SusD/RagB family
MIIGCLLLCSGIGCKKLVQVAVPDDQLDAGVIFASNATAQKAVTGIYINAMSNVRYLFNGGITLFTALSADELQRTSPLISEDPFYYNTLGAGTQPVHANLWKAAYTYIYHSNICIEGKPAGKRPFNRICTIHTCTLLLLPC